MMLKTIKLHAFVSSPPCWQKSAENLIQTYAAWLQRKVVYNAHIVIDKKLGKNLIMYSKWDNKFKNTNGKYYAVPAN